MGVDVPIDLPKVRGNLLEKASLFHFIAELGFKDDGEGSDGEIEIDSGGVPEAIRGGKGAAGNKVMEMGVILQGTSPCVEDAKEAREITADVVFVEGEFFDGLGGCLEEARVSHPLVFANEATQIFRDGKGEEEMMTGELALDL